MAKCENPDCPHKAGTAKFGRLVGSKWMLTCLWCDNQMGRKALVEHGLSCAVYEEAMYRQSLPTQQSIHRGF